VGCRNAARLLDKPREEEKSDMQDSMEIKQERDRYAGTGVPHEGIFAAMIYLSKITFLAPIQRL
jgi:hypothetical protein